MTQRDGTDAEKGGKQTQDVWTRETVDSPCVNICQMDPETQLCLGCARTLDEIGTWSRLSNDARRTIMDDLPNRTVSTNKRRGGRAGRLKRS